jgi:hypothetical protein
VLEFLNKLFPEELKSAIRFDLSLAESLAKWGCRRCNGHGYERVIRPDGTNEYKYCPKSQCSEYRLRKMKL